MGKDKIKRFKELETFENVLQPELTDLKPSFKYMGQWEEVFGNNNPIILELGCGKGEYTVGLARQFPYKNYIGIDIKGARIWKGAKTCIEENLNNVKFIRTQVDHLKYFFSENEVQEIWLTFSDPQPKKPSKRLTSPLFIDKYKKILSPSGIINLKTDSSLLYEYTLEQIKENNYTIIENSTDVYNELVPRSAFQLQQLLNIKTFYEQRWLKEGKKIKFLSFSIH